jgi:hypothetical protein
VGTRERGKYSPGAGIPLLPAAVPNTEGAASRWN